MSLKFLVFELRYLEEIALVSLVTYLFFLLDKNCVKVLSILFVL